MTLSVVVALTLTPALCASLLKQGQAREAARVSLACFQAAVFDQNAARTRRGSGLAWCARTAAGRAVGLSGDQNRCDVFSLFMPATPAGFLACEDQGTLFTLVQSPEMAPRRSATLEVIQTGSKTTSWKTRMTR